MLILYYNSEKANAIVVVVTAVAVAIATVIVMANANVFRSYGKNIPKGNSSLTEHLRYSMIARVRTVAVTVAAFLFYIMPLCVRVDIVNETHDFRFSKKIENELEQMNRTFKYSHICTVDVKRNYTLKIKFYRLTYSTLKT